MRQEWTGGGAYQDDGWWADVDWSEADDDGNLPPEIWPYPGQVLSIAIERDGRTVASGDATVQCQAYGGGVAMLNVHVDEEHRRRGLATALYDAAESAFGETLVPYGGGNEGGGIEAFWEARRRRAEAGPDGP